MHRGGKRDRATIVPHPRAGPSRAGGQVRSRLLANEWPRRSYGEKSYMAAQKGASGPAAGPQHRHPGLRSALRRQDCLHLYAPCRSCGHAPFHKSGPSTGTEQIVAPSARAQPLGSTGPAQRDERWSGLSYAFAAISATASPNSFRPTDTSSAVITSGGETVSYTHLRAHDTVLDLVCR